MQEIKIWSPPSTNDMDLPGFCENLLKKGYHIDASISNSHTIYTVIIVSKPPKPFAFGPK